MTLNCDVPGGSFYCYLRREFMYDNRDHHGETIPAAVLGITSIPTRALLFHVMTEEGAMWARMPIHALAWKPDAPAMDLETLELWDCFSYEVSAHAFAYLRGLRCRTRLRDGKWYDGQYRFTVDWHGNATSEDPGEGGHKNAHVIALDNGNFAAQPNNRIFWYEPSFITKPMKSVPDYRTNNHVWSVEGQRPWHTEDSDRFFYDVKPA